MGSGFFARINLQIAFSMIRIRFNSSIQMITVTYLKALNLA
jgi:hypothetical protein